MPLQRPIGRTPLTLSGSLRKSPTTRGRVAVTVLNFTRALFVQEYIYLSRKNWNSDVVHGQNMARQSVFARVCNSKTGNFI